jgi:hypothetical protein
MKSKLPTFNEFIIGTSRKNRRTPIRESRRAGRVNEAIGEDLFANPKIQNSLEDLYERLVTQIEAQDEDFEGSKGKAHQLFDGVYTGIAVMQDAAWFATTGMGTGITAFDRELNIDEIEEKLIDLYNREMGTDISIDEMSDEDYENYYLGELKEIIYHFSVLVRSCGRKSDSGFCVDLILDVHGPDIVTGKENKVVKSIPIDAESDQEIAEETKDILNKI